LREIRSLLLEEGKSKDILDSPPLEFAARALAEEKRRDSLLNYLFSGS